MDVCLCCLQTGLFLPLAAGGSPDYSAPCDGRVATEEGPRCPLQVGACEPDLELGGEVEDECEVEEQEDDANLREHV